MKPFRIEMQDKNSEWRSLENDWFPVRECDTLQEALSDASLLKEVNPQISIRVVSVKQV